MIIEEVYLEIYYLENCLYKSLFIIYGEIVLLINNIDNGIEGNYFY